MLGALLQGALIHFSGQYLLETKSLGIRGSITTGMSLPLGPFSGQKEDTGRYHFINQS